jgi:Flp pilus assembly protein TadG
MRTPRMTGRRRLAEEAGVSMLEFVLTLPFIWTILALTLHFGTAYLERQRTMVAVREVAFRHASLSAQSGPRDVGGDGRTVSAALLQPRKIAGSFSMSASNGGCPGRGGTADESPIRGAFSSVINFVGRMSSTQVYQLSARGQRVSGRLLPQAVHERCFAVDVSPWTYREVGGYGDMIGRAIGLGGF